MKRSILAFILALLLCFPALTACSKKEDGQQGGEPTQELTEKPTEAPTEKPTEETPSEPDTPAPEQPSEPSEPEKVVTDYTVADRVYSYYSAGYDMLAVALNANGAPVALELYSYRLFPISSLSFCTIEYDEYGKISAFVFKNDSVIHDQLFGKCDDITMKVTRHDKKGRPLKTESAQLVTLSFEYNDDAKTSTMSFTHVRMPGAYTLIFDEFGRLLSLDKFGVKSNIVYENSVATVSDPFYSSFGTSFKITYDGTRVTELKEIDSKGVAKVVTYSYGENGHCTSSLCKYSDNETEKYVFTYDKNDRLAKLEYFLTDGVEYLEETKINEMTYAYDPRGRLTETKTFTFTDAQNSYLSSVVQKAYGENGYLTSDITYTYDKDGYVIKDFISSYHENGNLKMTKHSEYEGYRTLLSDTTEYDELGRPTHVFSSKTDVNNHESESINTMYEYSDTDGDYTKISREYSYSSCHTQTTESYRSNLLREKEVVTYDSDMNVIDIITTSYDKDGNVIS